MEAARDVKADLNTIMWLERFDLVNRIVLSVASNFYGLFINDYFRSTVVVEENGIIDLAPSGTLGSSIISGQMSVVAGTVHVGFSALAAADYVPTVIVLSATDMSLAVPRIPPYSADSRTITGFDVDVFDTGTLYWEIEPASSSGVNDLRAGKMAVSPGTAHVSFSAVSGAAYVPLVFNLTATDISLTIPKIPPYSADSRTITGFDVVVFDAGTLYWQIVPALAQDMGSGEMAVSAGVAHVSFPATSNASYTPIVFNLTATDMSLAVARIPPYSADSRTTTGFDVAVFDTGTLYWVIVPASLTTPGVRLMKVANPVKVALQSTALENKAAIPVSLEAYLAFSPSAIQNRKTIVYVYAADKLLIKRGSSLSDFGTMTLWYPAIPDTVGIDTDNVDLPDGTPISIGVILLKEILRERLKLPKTDYRPELAVAVKNMYESYGRNASREIIREKVKAFG